MFGGATIVNLAAAARRRNNEHLRFSGWARLRRGSVEFCSDQSNLVSSFNVSSQTSSVLTIPSRATNVRFRAGSTQTEAYPLGSDGSAKVSFEVTASGTRKYGFFQGLGAPAEVQYQIAVKQGGAL